MDPGLASHWDSRYVDVGAEQVSWYRDDAVVSLELLSIGGVHPGRSVIDVGAGAGVLVDGLLAAGFDDVTALDVSPAGLAVARRRLEDPEGVTWVVADLLAWSPPRRYDAWHDRAVLHFLTEPDDVARYADLLAAGVGDGGVVVLGAFALDGPTQCSGLPVRRYDAAGLAAVAGRGFDLVTARREVHTTPGGAQQPFTWVVLRRRP